MNRWILKSSKDLILLHLFGSVVAFKDLWQVGSLTNSTRRVQKVPQHVSLLESIFVAI